MSLNRPTFHHNAISCAGNGIWAGVSLTHQRNIRRNLLGESRDRFMRRIPCFCQNSMLLPCFMRTWTWNCSNNDRKTQTILTKLSHNCDISERFISQLETATSVFLVLNNKPPLFKLLLVANSVTCSPKNINWISPLLFFQFFLSWYTHLSSFSQSTY